MLRAVNWGEKLGHVFGGHHGRILRILFLFLCSLGVLVVIYRARTERLNKESAIAKNNAKSALSDTMPSASSIKWVIVANPDLESTNDYGDGDNYVCAVATVARSAGWKTIIIGQKLNCCRSPDCYPFTKSQFLKMPYRTASVIKNLMESDSGKRSAAYKETIRNLAFLWAMHRGARYVFDAYVDEYQSARVKIPKFEEEFSRQLRTLALDESLALVEERSRSRTNVFRNPYSHFGRPDVRLLPSGPGSGGGAGRWSSFGQVVNQHQYTSFNLDHGHGPSLSKNTQRNQEYPTFRICEVRPPSIEKFLEIDEGWWDFKAPALVLPGDTMPPLCTRNTLFSPEVFWALPLLPDYSAAGVLEEAPGALQNTSRVPPWYIRGLWSQSLLGDLGGSIRLTLSRVPTLQINADSYSNDYDPHPLRETAIAGGNRTSSSKLMKRWHCRIRSTFRCLLLMAKELSKSVYMSKHDLSLIEAWVLDLKNIHYTEPPMLPKRRSHTNPCLGADGLHGVSFYPALEPNGEFVSEEFVGKRNDTLRDIVMRLDNDDSGIGSQQQGSRDKRETERPLLKSRISLNLTVPIENATFAPIDWETYGDGEKPRQPSKKDAPQPDGQGEKYKTREEFVYHHVILGDASEADPYSRRILPLVDKPVYPSRSSLSSNGGASVSGATAAARTGKQFKAFLQDVGSKTPDGGADDFPILKAITENMCPTFGPLIPYQPQVTYPDTLLIVVFTNQHYDLIPSLEVLYRSSFPNMLYCGHPHESVEIFLRKYQSVEHRSFSFLPTYTRATYECVLGAMEMNYEVKGYMVVTDETLINTWNIPNLDNNKLWVSSSGYDKVTRASWSQLDPGGQKLPRLLDGIVATWKLFYYILVGQDSYQFLEPRGGIKKRSLITEDGEEAGEAGGVVSNESLETDATAYIPGPQFKWNHTYSTNEQEQAGVKYNTTTGEEKPGDLLPSDFDYVKGALFTSADRDSRENETMSVDESVDDVIVGDQDEDNRPLETMELEEGLSSSSPTPEEKATEGVRPMTDAMLVTPTEESMENSTAIWSEGERTPKTEDSETFSSTTANPESSVGVPLYHVQHVEPPTPPTWHKPEEVSSTSPTTMDKAGADYMNDKFPGAGGSSSSSSNPGDSSPAAHIPKEVNVPTLSPPVSGSSTEKGTEPITISSTISSLLPNDGLSPADPADLELRGDMEALLDALHDNYGNLIQLVGNYQEKSEDSRKQEYSSEGLDAASIQEDSNKSHRISPREFRHIRCTVVDDGHQSELCTTLRTYINVLKQNIGRDIRLFHDTIPMYYLPTWATKPFYSVANILLHYGVMDELALPLIFRGLAPEGDWVHLNRTVIPSTSDNESPGDSSSSSSSSSTASDSGDSDSPPPPAPSESQYLHPFNLHKVYSDKKVKQSFCSNYLLRVLQM